MRSAQASSPFSAMHASRAFLVSGHAQHGLHLGFASVAAEAAASAATSTVGASEDILNDHEKIFPSGRNGLKFFSLIQREKL